jgi:peroxiredoxin
VELQSRVEELSQRGLRIAVVSYDAPEVIAAFSKDHGIAFPMLSDKGSAVITRYGILNTVVDEAFGPTKDDPAVQADVRKYASAVGAFPMMKGIAFPGTFILDRQGRVTDRFFEDFYVERSTASSILKRIDDGAGQVVGTKVSTAHLDVTTYPSDAVVAVGNRFSMVVEIDPGPGMHVYAPGASGYKVVSVRLDPQPLVRALVLEYPPSEIYHFEPLDERVPVYQQPFTLVQEMVVDGSPESMKALSGLESLTVTGALEYQACDDTLCFNPVSVPLSWTLSLRPLVTARPGAQ